MVSCIVVFDSLAFTKFRFIDHIKHYTTSAPKNQLCQSIKKQGTEAAPYPV